MSKIKHDYLEIRRVAGSRQLVAHNSGGLAELLATDPALWAVMSMPTEAVVFNEEFVTLMDSDRNKRIRPGELKAAIEWLLKVFRTYSGVDRGADELILDEINLESGDGLAIRRAAETILRNAGLPEAKQISFDLVMNRQLILSDALGNGDGVVPFENLKSAEVREYALAAAKYSKNELVDLSGLKGIDLPTLDKFRTALADYWLWKNDGESVSVLQLGDFSGKIYGLWSKIGSKIEEYFNLCSLLENSVAGEGCDFAAKLNVMDAAQIQNFWQNAPLAVPHKHPQLNAGQWLNPLYQEDLLKMLEFLRSAGILTENTILTLEQWHQVAADCRRYGEWLGRSKDEFFDGIAPELLLKWSKNQEYEVIKDLIDVDLQSKSKIDGYGLLRKAMLYQRYMLEFVNNFISLEKLFDRNASGSLIQPGKLILDSRHFSLVSKVSDLASHKKIIERSDICVIYAEITTGELNNLQKMLIAAAVTNGDMKNIFVGKTGVFVTNSGVEWDARVVDIVQFPVSFREALSSPFYRLGAFVGKQADKFFAIKNKEMENNMSAATTATATTNVTASESDKRNAVNAPLMLMGGSVGIAALGSSFAFILNAVKNTTLWNILAVLLGIMIVLCGPILIVSIVKLFSRSVAVFLAASGWAVNPQMRLSHRMGVVFTSYPRFRDGKTVRIVSLKKYWILIIIVAAAAGGYWIYNRFYAPVPEAKIENVPPAADNPEIKKDPL
ncbi:MAG: hypothetical protein MST10_07320 [Lentisphaeria bacterium]|nr:hypothetical protein [Lentisphaeria bacterium]